MKPIEMETGKRIRKIGKEIRVETREYFLIPLPDGRVAGTKAETQEEAVETINRTLREVA